MTSISKHSNPSFATFWQMRGQQCFLITHYISYPVGASLAWAASKARLTPNQVTSLCAICASGGAAWVAFSDMGAIWGGVLLFCALHLAHALDCADGILARATGQGSIFGAIFDKVVDTASTILVPGFLCIGGLDEQIRWLPERWISLASLLIILSRTLLVSTIWLKDFVVRAGDHLVEDNRERTLGWWLRRFIGGTTDTPLFYTGLAVGWATGFYWEFIAAYGFWIIGVWLGYLALAYRDLRHLKEH